MGVTYSYFYQLRESYCMRVTWNGNESTSMGRLSGTPELHLHLLQCNRWTQCLDYVNAPLKQ